MNPRDRDGLGRPQQARPRDALGRPLPYGSAGVPPAPQDPLPPHETVEVATALAESGRAFSAHEVFEARWKDTAHHERDLWQGLAQLCVAETHARRGNAVGASRLLARGSARIEAYRATGGPVYGADLDWWLSRAQTAVAAATPTVR